jgi:hypothetical protein
MVIENMEKTRIKKPVFTAAVVAMKTKRDATEVIVNE